MTLREFIESLNEIVSDEAMSDQIEVVSIADDGKYFTPVISLGTDKDGVRRIHI